MNQPENDLGNSQPTSVPVTPTGWAPQATPAPAQPVTPAAMSSINEAPATPFESSVPDLTGPTGPSSMDGGSNTGMEPMRPKSNKGLIIILVVLILIGGLIIVVWKGGLNFGSLLGKKTPTPAPSPTESFSPAPIVNKNDAARKADLANLKTALIRYYNDKQSYPVSPVVAKASDPNGVLKVLVTNNYIAQLPVDPLSPNSYYGYKSDGKSFTLSATLEDRTDPTGVPMGDLYLYQITDTSVEPPLVGPDAIAPSTSQTTTNFGNTINNTQPIASPALTSSSSSSSSSSSNSGTSESSSSSDTSTSVSTDTDSFSANSSATAQ